MDHWFQKRPFLATGILLAPIAVATGFISAGFGHGDYVAARVVVPFACLCVGDYFAAAWAVTLLALLQ
jgi:hypothetical protein